MCLLQLLPERTFLFGEMLPQAKLQALTRELSEGFDMVFSIGTTSVFPYIAAPVLEAVRQGIPTVEINPGESSVSDAVQFRLIDGAERALRQIWSALETG